MNTKYKNKTQTRRDDLNWDLMKWHDITWPNVTSKEHTTNAEDATTDRGKHRA